jgi:hypothetical protein
MALKQTTAKADGQIGDSINSANFAKGTPEKSSNSFLTLNLLLQKTYTGKL